MEGGIASLVLTHGGSDVVDRGWKVILSLLMVIAVGCGEADRQSARKPVVFVSVLPQAYFAERIAGDAIDVEVLVRPGDNPHTYEPTPKEVVRISQANALLTAEMPFEKALVRKLSAEDGLTIINVLDGIETHPFAEDHDDHEGDAHHDQEEHDHDDHGDHGHHDHAHGEMDPHVWMSPRLASQMAGNIARALIEIAPEHRETFQANLADLQADLKALDHEIATSLAPLKGKTFYVFHPAFGYFAQRYGLRQEAVEIGGKQPGPRHVKELVDRARREGVRVIFVQPQFSDRAARTIAEQIGGAVVPIDPLGKNYIENMRTIATTIRDALQAPAADNQAPDHENP
jgi:zinc transport system substrate-binding protein